MEEFSTSGDQAQRAHGGKMIWRPRCSEMKRIIWMDDTIADTRAERTEDRSDREPRIPTHPIIQSEIEIDMATGLDTTRIARQIN